MKASSLYDVTLKAVVTSLAKLSLTSKWFDSINSSIISPICRIDTKIGLHFR